MPMALPAAEFEAGEGAAAFAARLFDYLGHECNWQVRTASSSRVLVPPTGTAVTPAMAWEICRIIREAVDAVHNGR